MSVGTALRIVHFAYYTERENNERYALWLLFDVRRVRGQNARYPINGQIVRVRVGICLVAHREIFLAVCTRDFPRIHQMHTHCRPRRRFLHGTPNRSVRRIVRNSIVGPPASRTIFRPFFAFFFFFLSFFLYTLQNDYAKQDHGQLISLRQRQLNI